MTVDGNFLSDRWIRCDRVMMASRKLPQCEKIMADMLKNSHTCSATTKKPTCGAFSLDGAHAFAADKFGDVAVAASASGASAPLLGHYCSTVSSMAVSPDGETLCQQYAGPRRAL